MATDPLTFKDGSSLPQTLLIDLDLCDDDIVVYEAAPLSAALSPPLSPYQTQLPTPLLRPVAPLPNGPAKPLMPDRERSPALSDMFTPDSSPDLQPSELSNALDALILELGFQCPTAQPAPPADPDTTQKINTPQNTEDMPKYRLIGNV